MPSGTTVDWHEARAAAVPSASRGLVDDEPGRVLAWLIDDRLARFLEASAAVGPTPLPLAGGRPLSTPSKDLRESP